MFLELYNRKTDKKPESNRKTFIPYISHIHGFLKVQISNYFRRKNQFNLLPRNEGHFLSKNFSYLNKIHINFYENFRSLKFEKMIRFDNKWKACSPESDDLTRTLFVLSQQ